MKTIIVGDPPPTAWWGLPALVVAVLAVTLACVWGLVRLAETPLPAVTSRGDGP